MLNKLREKNKFYIDLYRKNSDESNIFKHQVISEMLEYEDCFERLSIEEAKLILESLHIENWKEFYLQLIKK